MFDKIKNKSKDLNDSIKEKVGELGGKATSLLGDGLSEINGLKPVLEKSGIIIGDVFLAYHYHLKSVSLLNKKLVESKTLIISLIMKTYLSFSQQ